MSNNPSKSENFVNYTPNCVTSQGNKARNFVALIKFIQVFKKGEKNLHINYYPSLIKYHLSLI